MIAGELERLGLVRSGMAGQPAKTSAVLKAKEPEVEALFARLAELRRCASGPTVARASAAGQYDALKGTVARHIDRFAFREAPLAFDWQDTLNG